MTESSDKTVETIPGVASAPVAAESKPNRLYQVAAWVAIVAGTLFIIAVIFFTGFLLGRHSDGPGRFDRHPWGPMMHHGGPDRGPGNPGPGNFGLVGPGNPGHPGQPPTPSTR